MTGCHDTIELHYYIITLYHNDIMSLPYILMSLYYDVMLHYDITTLHYDIIL